MAFPTAAILDNFNRTDEGPPPSADWSTFDGSGHEVVSNQMVPSGAGDDISTYDAQSIDGDFEVFVTFATFGSGGTIGAIDTSTINGYTVVADGSNIYLNRTDGGSDNTIDTTAQVVNNGDAIGLYRHGTTVESWFKDSAGSWTMIASVTDATHTASGWSPIVITSSGSEVLDDFGGGAPVAATIPRVYHHRQRNFA